MTSKSQIYRSSDRAKTEEARLTPIIDATPHPLLATQPTRRAERPTLRVFFLSFFLCSAFMSGAAWLGSQYSGIDEVKGT
jgi:hypothetical protein